MRWNIGQSQEQEAASPGVTQEAPDEAYGGDTRVVSGVGARR